MKNHSRIKKARPYSEEEEFGEVFPSHTSRETLFGVGMAPLAAGQYPLRQLPRGIGQNGSSAGYYWAHTPFSTSDLLNWKSSNPSYRDDPGKMTDLITSIFASRLPNWANI